MSAFCRRVMAGWAAVLVWGFTVAGLAAQTRSSYDTPQNRQDVPVYTSDGISGKGVGDASVTQPPEAVPQPHKADGKRQTGLPVEAYAVPPGTKFLVDLEDELTSKGTEENKRIRVSTLEALEAGSGIYLPAGAEIEGRVTRVESAGVAGHAKILLTFDYIHTRFGKLPIVAEVSGVPGDHSVKSEATKEGSIEGRSSTQQDAAEAAAIGAAISAMKGVKDKDKREAAEGAAAAAIAAYLAESGRGHELNIPKGAKLELELQRALYLLKE